MYYNIQLKYYEPRKSSIGTPIEDLKIEQEYDLLENEATEFGNQYCEGCVFFKGKSIHSSAIKEVEIRESQIKIGGTLGCWNTFVNSPVVTRRFIKSPPNNLHSQQNSQNHVIKKKKETGKNVFIAYHESQPMKDLKNILYDLGLNPIVLDEQPSGGSNTLIEKLEHYSDVSYAFIILTPDDIGGSSGILEKEMSEFKPPFDTVMNVKRILKQDFKRRARQNVILEFGYFVGKLGRLKVSCLYKGTVDFASDMKGVMYIPFDHSVEEVRLKIMKELDAAGFDIKI